MFTLPRCLERMRQFSDTGRGGMSARRFTLGRGAFAIAEGSITHGQEGRWAGQLAAEDGIGLIFIHKGSSRFEMGQNGAIFCHGWPTMTLLSPDHDPMVAQP